MHNFYIFICLHLFLSTNVLKSVYSNVKNYAGRKYMKYVIIVIYDASGIGDKSIRMSNLHKECVYRTKHYLIIPGIYVI